MIWIMIIIDLKTLFTLICAQLLLKKTQKGWINLSFSCSSMSCAIFRTLPKALVVTFSVAVVSVPNTFRVSVYMLR